MFDNDTGVWRSVETTGDMRGSGEWLENMSVFAGPGWARGTKDVNDISRQFSLLNILYLERGCFASQHLNLKVSAFNDKTQVVL